MASVRTEVGFRAAASKPELVSLRQRVTNSSALSIRIGPVDSASTSPRGPTSTNSLGHASGVGGTGEGSSWAATVESVGSLPGGDP